MSLLQILNANTSFLLDEFNGWNSDFFRANVHAMACIESGGLEAPLLPPTKQCAKQ
jgi:hypothetical protein